MGWTLGLVLTQPAENVTIDHVRSRGHLFVGGLSAMTGWPLPAPSFEVMEPQDGKWRVSFDFEFETEQDYEQFEIVLKPYLKRGSDVSYQKHLWTRAVQYARVRMQGRPALDTPEATP